MLLSKDINSVLESDDAQWMFDGEERFLDGENIDGERIAFVSHPRSGNSFLRKYLEAITGTITTSDMGLGFYAEF